MTPPVTAPQRPPTAPPSVPSSLREAIRGIAWAALYVIAGTYTRVADGLRQPTEPSNPPSPAKPTPQPKESRYTLTTGPLKISVLVIDKTEGVARAYFDGKKGQILVNVDEQVVLELPKDLPHNYAIQFSRSEKSGRIEINYGTPENRGRCWIMDQIFLESIFPPRPPIGL
jgi:hypothetical protein